jgi:hypothetical protein
MPRSRNSTQFRAALLDYGYRRDANSQKPERLHSENTSAWRRDTAKPTETLGCMTTLARRASRMATALLRMLVALLSGY